MWEVVVLTSTTLLSFSYYIGHRRGYAKGYVTGGRKILGEWKKFNEEVEK